MMALRFEGHRPVIVAIDGQPCEPHEPEGGRILLGPAMRADVALDMQGEPGGRYAVIDDFYPDLAYTLTHLAYDAEAAAAGPSSRRAFEPPANPCPNPTSQPPSATSSGSRAA